MADDKKYKLIEGETKNNGEAACENIPEKYDFVAEIQDLTSSLMNLASKCKQSIRKANPDSDPSKNFTWEHFFTEHCGILPDDASQYEDALIAHRMDPFNYSM